MRTLKILALTFVLATVAVAFSSDIPVDDTRLSIHTLVREDIFAGFLENDLDRLSRGEKNVELLLEKRPKARAELLAWKAGATLYRATVALEKNQRAEFEQKYKQALALFDEAKQLGPNNGGVHAVTGGSLGLFADRLPKELRPAAWERSYNAYQVLWKLQGAGIDKFPVHFRGEVLGGITQSAMRTGRTQEANEFLDKMLVMLAGTPYEPTAKRWKADPKAVEKTSLLCMNCHEPGRLEATVTKLNKTN